MLQKWVHSLVVTLATVALTACTPVVTPTTSASPSGPLPGDQMVFRVITAGGLVPPVYYLLESPSLVMYGDGRVLAQAADSGHGWKPARFEVSRVDPMTIARFAAKVEASRLISKQTDFGQSRVTDQASTRVLLHGAGEPIEVGVYALSETFDSGLSWGQRQARSALRALIEQGHALAGDAPRTAYEPEEVTVFEIAAQYAPSPDPATVTWPGPDPDSFLKPASGRAIACGHLVGEPAQAAYRAALANPGAHWIVAGKERVLAVNPMPAFAEC